MCGGDQAREGFIAEVARFHAAFGLPQRSLPGTDVDEDVKKLRFALLEEEVGEYVQAAEADDVVKIADALADIVYVAYGTAVTYGIDLDAVLSEVHRSNMSKLDADGKPLLDENGKVRKSEQYTPPDVAAILNTQAPLPQ